MSALLILLPNFCRETGRGDGRCRRVSCCGRFAQPGWCQELNVGFLRLDAGLREHQALQGSLNVERQLLCGTAVGFFTCPIWRI